MLAVKKLTRYSRRIKTMRQESEAVFISILTCQLSSFFVQNFVQRTTTTLYEQRQLCKDNDDFVRIMFTLCTNNVNFARTSTCSSCSQSCFTYRRKFHGAIHTGVRRSGHFMGSYINFWQSWRCYDKVVVVLAKSSLSLQSWRCSHKAWTLFVQSCRCPCKVDVVLCTKFCTKKEESWQVDIDIKTASYHLPHSFFLREYRVNFFTASIEWVLN